MTVSWLRLTLLASSLLGCSGQSVTPMQTASAACPETSNGASAAPALPVVAAGSAAVGAVAGGASANGGGSSTIATTLGGAATRVAPMGGAATGTILATTSVTAANTSAQTAPVAGPSLTGILRGVVTSTPTAAAQHAVVYLENAPVTKIVDARVDDVKMNFFPYISIVTVGGTLTTVNKQPFPDSVFSTSNEKWDFGMIEAGGVRKRKFEKAGAYNLLCHLHPNQLAFVVATPSSYFAKTDKQGSYEIRDVPAGTFNIVAWAPRVTIERKSVTVSGGESTVDFALKR